MGLPPVVVGPAAPGHAPPFRLTLARPGPAQWGETRRLAQAARTFFRPCRGERAGERSRSRNGGARPLKAAGTFGIAAARRSGGAGGAPARSPSLRKKEMVFVPLLLDVGVGVALAVAFDFLDPDAPDRRPDNPASWRGWPGCVELRDSKPSMHDRCQRPLLAAGVPPVAHM